MISLGLNVAFQASRPALICAGAGSPFLIGTIISASMGLVLLLVSRHTLLDIARTMDPFTIPFWGAEFTVVMLRASGALCVVAAILLFVLYWVLD